MHLRNAAAMIAVLSASDAVAAEPVGAFAGGQAGAGMAHPYSSDAASVNPAVIGLVERYDSVVSADIGARALGAHGLVVDSRTMPRLSMAVGYRYRRINPPMTDSELPGWLPDGEAATNKSNGHGVTLAFAAPLADRHLSLGIGGDLSRDEHERRGVVWDGDLDVGVAWRPTGSVAVGVGGRDLLPLASLDHPARVGGGVWLGAEDLGGLAVDATWRVVDGDGSPLDVAVGLQRQVTTANFTAGWRWDGRYARHAVTAGFGWSSEGQWLDLAVDVPVTGEATARDVVVKVGARIRS